MVIKLVREWYKKRWNPFELVNILKIWIRRKEKKMPVKENVREKVPVIVKRREIAIEENKPEKQTDKSYIIPRRWRVQ
jgi:hypothetical protein